MMKALLPTMLWLLAAIGAAGQTPAPALPAALPASDTAAGKLRVVTYNVLGGRNTDGKRDFGRIATALKILNADLMGLQEVDVGTKRLKSRDLPAELEKLTGWKAIFAPAMPLDTGRYGGAALVRLPILKESSELLPRGPKCEPRVALFLECQFPPGTATALRFATTHLENADADIKQKQAQALVAALAAGKEMPSLLVGDFNCEPGSPTAQTMLGNWENLWTALPGSQQEATWPSTGPTERIDYIFASKQPTRWKLLRILRGDAIFPGNATWKELLLSVSDHLPVMAELELLPP